MTSDSETARFTNRLAAEKSPYLLQHAHNPVDWFPWGDEAFEKARAEDKPVLVSIGYATCHWCHVMERESFESEDLAELLNEHFVAIKVDREERPDVDKIYMDALHALGEQGGWPLNMFLTPEGVPFTGGTYFPPRPRFGRPSFRQVLERIQQLWSSGRDRIESTAGELRQHLEGLGRTTLEGAPEDLTREPEERMVQFARNTYDRLDGGFQYQPRNKFPPSMSLMQLLRVHERASDEGLVEIIEHTLERMKSGGIYDQLGGGLSRYSTDYQWLVPHFEKMLYDNALWVQCLVEVGQALGAEPYREWAADTLAYIKRDMTSPEGAFYSAEDADSEGEEGKFYVWAKAELEELLDATTAAVAIRRWGVTDKGNFEGANILHVARTVKQVAAETELEEAEVERRLAEAREVLFKHREGRVRPLCDDKILVSWNALMISAMAKFGRAFESEDEIERAVRAAEFILREMVDDSGRLLRRWRDGEARYKAYLVDHAQLAVACLDLFEATEDRRWFREAVKLCEAIEALFRDPEGACFDTGSDAEALLTRTTESYDGVEPSGNSATAWAYLRLYTLTGEDRWRDGAERILRCFAGEMERRGPGCAFMLRSLDFLLSGCGQLIVVGDPGSDEYQAVRRLIRTRFIPDATPLLVPADRFDAWREDFPVLEGRAPEGGEGLSIYLCRNQTCQRPMHSASELERELF